MEMETRRRRGPSFRLDDDGKRKRVAAAPIGAGPWAPGTTVLVGGQHLASGRLIRWWVGVPSCHSRSKLALE